MISRKDQVDQGNEVQQPKKHWAQFALKFRAISDERGYNKILDRSVTVPTEDAKLADDEK